MTASAIYEGTIRHRRFAVRAHEFSHRVALAYLDLDELDGLLGGRLVADASGPRSLPPLPTTSAIPPSASPTRSATLVERTDGRGADGADPPAHAPAHFGHCFNPVSFYYCFTPQEQLEAVVAEVTNTPWGERHAYVLARADEGPVLDGRALQRSSTSPRSWAWSSATCGGSPRPAPTLSVHIDSERERRAFDATLALRRTPFTRGRLAGVTARYPAATLRVLGAHLRPRAALKLKGVPLHPRPQVPA